MGRYYSGDISGKFWFAVQDSTDASHFGKEYEEVYTYYVCGCEFDGEEYCTGCYGSIEEHTQAMLEEEDEDTRTWHISNSVIKYSFGESDIHTVSEEVTALESDVGHHIDEYGIDDETMEYVCSFKQECTEEEVERIARLCLGRQILYCLKKTGSCAFSAEL